MKNSVSDFLNMLNEAQVEAPRTRAYLHMVERVREQAPITLEQSIATTVKRMVKPSQRWRIAKAVWPNRPDRWVWPVPGWSLAGVLQECRRLQNAQVKKHLARHWSYDQNTMVALIQAEKALTILEGEKDDG